MVAGAGLSGTGGIGTLTFSLLVMAEGIGCIDGEGTGGSFCWCLLEMGRGAVGAGRVGLDVCLSYLRVYWRRQAGFVATPFPDE